MKKLKLLLITSIILSLFSTVASADTAQKIVYDFFGNYSEGMAVAGVWGHEWKYGYIDSKAKLVIEPKYRDARGFVLGVASVGVVDSGKAIKYGFINKNGTYIIKPTFDETGDFHKIPNTKTEVAVVGVGEDKDTRKYGLIKKDGTYLVTPQFDHIQEYTNPSSSGGFTSVYNKINGKECYGLLDPKGKLVVETKYKFISVSNYDIEVGFIRINGEDYLTGIYDIERNKVIEPEFTSVTPVDDGLKIAKKIDGIEKFGFYFINGTVVEPKYDWLSHWDSEAILSKTELGGKYGLLGKNGVDVLEPIYDEIRDLGDWQYAELNGKTILITKNGKFIDDKQFDSVGHLGNFNLLEVKANGMKGLLDLATNTYLVEPIYDEIYAFEDGYAEVKLNGKEGVIDRTGKVILEPVYDYIYTKVYTSQIKEKNSDGSYRYRDDTSKPPVVKLKKDGKEFYMNSDFTPIKKDANSAVGDFDSIGVFEDGMARVTKGDKIGYVKEDLSYIVKAVWDSAFRSPKSSNPEDGYKDYFNIQKGEKWGIVFMDGTVKEPISETICRVGENIAIVKINGKWRYINKNNKYLNNEEYLDAYAFSEGVGFVQKEFLENYFIDINGKRVSYIYKGGSSYSEGLAYVHTEAGGKYIDHKGKIIIGDKFYMYYGYPFKDGSAIVGISEAGKSLYGLIKKDGTWLVKPIFDKVDIKNDKFVLYQNGKEAEITPTGKIIWK